jgi:hypothetical protein
MNAAFNTWTVAPTPHVACLQVAPIADGAHDLIAVRPAIQEVHAIER